MQLNAARLFEFAIAAFFLSRGFLYLFEMFRRIRACSTQTVGYVAGFHEEEITQTVDGVPHESIVYTPVISYMVHGRLFRAESSCARGTTPLEIGHEVTVRYNPENPEEFYIAEDRMTSSYLPGIAMAAIGIALAAAGMH